MDIRTAILKAADHIQANPMEYRFMSTRVPSGPGCGTPGCIAGWVGHFLGMKAGAGCWLHSEPGLEEVFGVPFETFESRMLQWFCDGPKARFVSRANDAANFLRYYADAFHPEQTEEYPSIRAELDRIASMQVERAGTG